MRLDKQKGAAVVTGGLVDKTGVPVVVSNEPVVGGPVVKSGPLVVVDGDAVVFGGSVAAVVVPGRTFVVVPGGAVVVP